MDTSTHILVIVLSVMLALFLLLAISIAILTIKLLRSINALVQKAEGVVANVENVGRMVQNISGGPLSAIRMVQNIVDGVTQHTKHNRGEK